MSKLLNEGWKNITLGDVITVQRGFDLPTNKRQKGNVPVISSSGINGYHNFVKVKAPGVITGRYGTLGEVFYIEQDFWPLNTTLYVKNFKGNHPKFISYFLKTLNLAHQNAAGAVPGLNRNALHLIPVIIPPLPTQQKIAAILSNYDDLIENNTRRIKILEEMAQTLYHEWFVKFRFPGHEQVKMVESELGLIPEGWEVRQLSEVSQRITDGSHWSPKSVEEGYPMASVKDMDTWGLNVESCRKISQQDYEKLVRNDCKPLKDDILIAKDGNTYLKHIFVVEKEIDIVLLSSIAIVRPNLNKILPYVLAFHLLDTSVKARLKNYVSGAAIPRIILKDFARFPIVVPPIDIQHKFFNLVEAIIKDCHCLIAKNNNLRKTRDLLLPKLISGEIDVENLEIDTGNIAA